MQERTLAALLLSALLAPLDLVSLGFGFSCHFIVFLLLNTAFLPEFSKPLLFLHGVLEFFAFLFIELLNVFQDRKGVDVWNVVVLCKLLSVERLAGVWFA